MSAIAIARLNEERKNWRKDHPPEFWARPVKKSDNSADLMTWEAGIPGKPDTDWAGGEFRVVMKFSADYPSKPPVCRFQPVIFHPNVFSCGTICLSILNEEQGWRPGITVKQILMGIQDLLDDPNPRSPANGEANTLFLKNKAKYSQRVKEQARSFPPAG